MAVHYTDLEQMHGEQADILWELLTQNPKLVRRSAMSVNQQLNTKSARIISAINEIKQQADVVTASVTKAMGHVNDVVGDVSDPAMKAKLDELGGNVIDAAHDLKGRMDDILEEAKQYADEKVSSVKIDLIDGGLF